MVKIILSIEGMSCGMCEEHINDAIRKDYKVKKVTSSHGKAQTIILSEQTIDEASLKRTIDVTGYKLSSYHVEPYQKKRFLLF